MKNTNNEKQNKKRIAVFVITYNHPQIVSEVLALCGKEYYDRNIDLFFYEGSSSDETRNVVERYINLGLHNLIFKSFPNTTIEDRIEAILSDKELISMYEYLWLTKDRSYCAGTSLDRIIEETNNAPDVIMIGSIGAVSDCFYDNPALFYKDWGWLTTSLDVLIYNTSSLLQQVEAEKYNFIFGIVSLLFEQLAKLAETRISVLCKGVSILSSDKVTSMWEKQIFKVWKDDWIEANIRLPQIYNDFKDKVIKEAPSLPWILGNRYRLFELFQKGILTENELPMIEKNWEKISDIPISVLRTIARGEYDPYHSLVELHSDNEYVNSLISVTKVVYEKKAEAKQFSIEDIEKIAVSVIMNKTNLQIDEKVLRIGSIRDICLLISEKMDDGDYFVKQMQVLILLISNN